MGNKGGEMKTNSAAGTGAFKDQVGGQGAGGVEKGEKVDAAGESYTDMAKNVLTGNFGKGAKVRILARRITVLQSDPVLMSSASSTLPLDLLLSHLLMPALNPESPRTRSKAKVTRTRISSTRTPRKPILEKAMPHLNLISLRNPALSLSRSGATQLGLPEDIPRLLTLKLRRKVM
jgi:hypothetical protein